MYLFENFDQTYLIIWKAFGPSAGKQENRNYEPNILIIFVLLWLPTTDSHFLQCQETDHFIPCQFQGKHMEGMEYSPAPKHWTADFKIPSFFLNTLFAREK